MNLPTGHYLQNGKYRLLHVVGQGGFGITYKGVLFTEVKGALGKIKTEVPISIKEYFFKDYCYRNTNTFEVHVHSETGKLLFNKFKEKLIKEAKILSDVHHPNIVNVLDVFEENNTAYIAMEFISGHSLKYILENEGILPEKRVLKYIHQVGKALQFVHEKNIVHLDIKPSNILIDKNDNARLIDFGVSKRYDIEEQETSTTMLTLSKGFASIEQYDNEGTQTFSPCPDIYSLGATMYNLLTGKIPVESILRATRPLKTPYEFNPDITLNTEEVILKAMQVAPEGRFTSVQEMLDTLDPPPLDDEKKDDFQQGPVYTKSEDESTVLYTSQSSLKSADDDEQTVVNNVGDFPFAEKHRKRKKNKKKKRTLVITFIGIFVLIGSSVAFLLGYDKPTSKPIKNPILFAQHGQDEEEAENDTINQQTSQLVDETDSLSISNRQEETPTDIDDQPERKEVEIEPVRANETELPDRQISTEEMKENNKDVNRSIEIPPESTTIENVVVNTELRYANLISSGKTKMQTKDFDGAEKDFMEAYGVRPTDEVRELMRENNIKRLDKQVTDKFSLYEEKSMFGRLRIVRRISTGTYGAIDDRGEEVIICKYSLVEKTEDGYAFVREDGLFDIYNSDGRLLKEGVGTY